MAMSSKFRPLPALSDSSNVDNIDKKQSGAPNIEETIEALKQGIKAIITTIKYFICVQEAKLPEHFGHLASPHGETWRLWDTQPNQPKRLLPLSSVKSGACTGTRTFSSPKFERYLLVVDKYRNADITVVSSTLKPKLRTMSDATLGDKWEPILLRDRLSLIADKIVSFEDSGDYHGPTKTMFLRSDWVLAEAALRRTVGIKVAWAVGGRLPPELVEMVPEVVARMELERREKVYEWSEREQDDDSDDSD